MEFTEFEAKTDDNDKRLDKLLKRLLEDNGAIDTNSCQLLRKNLIKINCKKSKPDYRIKTGDTIQIASFLLGSSKKGTEKKDVSKIQVEVVFKNEHILIVNKPAGINVQSASKDDTSLSDAVKELFPPKDSLSFKTGPLHRIDKYTSGLVCFSQSQKGALWFTKCMEEHKINKEYLAIAEGIMTVNKTLNYRDWIKSEEISGTGNGFSTVTVYSSETECPQAKEALSEVTPIKELEIKGIKATLVKVRIFTGRKHQIRAQMAKHGNPLLGDTAYGGTKTKNGFNLQAFRLNFPKDNPIGLPETIELPLTLENIKF